MVDATTQETGVESEQSVQARLVSFYAKGNQAPKAEPAPVAEAPEPQANAEEIPEPAAEQAEPDEAPEEYVEEETPSPAVEFEIVHNGQQHKLTRAQTIELAQKGFDYTTKTQRLASSEAQIAQALQAAQEIAQVQASLAPEIGQVEGFRSAVAEYKDVNWVQLAQQDPSLYAQHRARYDTLRDGLQQAEGTLNQKFQTVRQGKLQAETTLQNFEKARMAEVLPWWNDSKKREAEVAKLTKAAIADGYTAEELASVPQARYIRTLWKAAEYDRLTSSQGVKLKQMREAPPMVKPGAANPAPSQATQAYAKTRQALKKSGNWQDAAALFAMREKVKK